VSWQMPALHCKRYKSREPMGTFKSFDVYNLMIKFVF
jgi:hypothetical protein